MRVLRVSIGVGAVLFFALACGGGGAATNAPATGSTATQPVDGELPVTCGASVAAAQTEVAIANNAFDPSSVTVAVGAIVSWTNNDSTDHTVTFDASPDCDRVLGGESIASTFNAAGSYAYHCRIHPSMTGTVVVQ